MTAIKVRGLRKKYGNFEALKGITFEIEKGEIIGFLGPNGAGKTTTMKILTCFIAANSGEAKVMGHDCFKEPLEVRQKIGYLPENNPLYHDMIVTEYLEYMADLHGVPSDQVENRISKVVESCGLIEKMDEPIGNLSKGYRQRVGLAAAMIHNPEILILDEPTAGLDPNQIVEIRTLIKELGREKTVILCSHLLREVELTCNRLIIIDHGRIVASGTPQELRGLVVDHANLRVVIRGGAKEALAILKAIPGVKDVVSSPADEKGATAFDLVTAEKKDLRPQIAQEIVQHDLKLLEMHREIVSLEDIFNQVTKTK